ncbi:MAG: ABC transporter permease [Gemmatimonadales bacterium]
MSYIVWSDPTRRGGETCGGYVRTLRHRVAIVIITAVAEIAHMDTFVRDLKFGLRMILKNPGVSSLAIIALALGIGLTTTTFSIVYGAIIRGLPFEESENLIHIERTSQDRESFPVSIHDFVDWREQQTVFEDVAAFRMGTVNVAGTEGRPERYSGAFITPAAFRLLRTTPFMGRTFTDHEDLPGATPVIIIGYGVWQERFGSDPDILGKTLRANGEAMSIIGVMPEQFEFPVLQQIWLPLRMDPSQFDRDDGFWLEVMGRLRDGVSMEQAQVEFATIASRLGEAYPETNEGVSTLMKPYPEEFIGSETRNLLFTMLGAVFLVLIIACANVANLLLARASVRTKEIAVRTALGASRARVVSQLLAEALVLSVIGGALGTGIAFVGIRWFADKVASTNPPFWLVFELDSAAFGFIVAATLATSVLAGGLPAFKASGGDINEVLKDESRGSSSMRIGRFSKSLVVMEIALSCGLLVVSGLMIKGVVKLGRADFGFEANEIFTARVGLFDADYPGERDRLQFWQQLTERLEVIPGAEAASLASVLPVQGACCWRFGIEGVEYERNNDMPLTSGVVATPGYFDVFEMEAIEGRLLQNQDVESGVPVVVVNESFVRRHMAEGDVLGKRVKIGNMESENPWRTIVGIVPDQWLDDADNERHDGFYIPLDQRVARFMTITLRTNLDNTLTLTQNVRNEVNAIDPNLPIYNVRTMEGVIAEETWFYGIFGILFTFVGGAALFLASVGLYGVMSFSVANRTQEVGIRMALGAGTQNVLRLILRQGLWQVGIGITLGTGLALALSRGMQLLFFDVEPWDVTIFSAIVVILTVTGIVASMIPANRATRIDPMEALRCE